MLSLLRERPFLVIGWLFAIIFALQFLVPDFANAWHSPIWQVSRGTLLGRDFANVFTAGHMVLGGPLGSIYDVDAYRAYQDQLFAGAVEGHNYSYTPVSFFYVWLFVLTPYLVSLLLWQVVTGAAFALAARPWLKPAEIGAWAALLLPASLMNIWAGHYGFLFGALWLGAWRWLDERPRLAGLMIGLMIVKPHLALLMPLALARRGAWRAFAVAGLVAGLLVLASGLVFGWAYWQTWLSTTLFQQAAMIGDTGKFFLRMMPTVTPSLLLAGAPAWAAWAAQLVLGLGAVVFVLVRLPKDPLRAGLAVMAATFLVLPYAFIYDMTVFSLAAVLIVAAPEKTLGPVWRAVAVLAFLLPVVAVLLGDHGLPLAPLLVAFVLAWTLRDPSPAEGAAVPPLEAILQPG